MGELLALADTVDDPGVRDAVLRRVCGTSEGTHDGHGRQNAAQAQLNLAEQHVTTVW